MLRSYDEVTSTRRARLSPDAESQSSAFAHAYDVAMEVVTLRLQRGFTQTQLAERCGMDQADISRIERGSTSPTARTLQRLAEALEADVRLVARTS